MAGSRVKNSLNNIFSGFLSRIVSMLLGFVVRTVFIKTIGNDYLGINGLYTNVLSMLSLADLGFGTAMVYSMYKPIADQNYDKISSLMALYSKVYKIVGTVIFALGLALIPFMDYIIKDPPKVSNLLFYYVLFLLNTVLSYWFFAYKRSFVIANQQNYIVTNYSTLFHIIKSIFQIILLFVFKMYLLYLVAQIVSTILENICISMYCDKHNPKIKTKNANKLEKSETNRIWNDVKALMLSRVAHVALNSTDNIIISSIVGIKWVGLLSNYTLLVESITAIVSQIISSFTASIGNYFAKENEDSKYGLFCKIEFLSSWLYAICSLFLFVLLNPFITIWIGPDYILETKIVFVICLNFYVAGFMSTLFVFRSTLGLFTQGKYRPVIVATINIGLSILLGKIWGLFGVLIATFISRACVNLWYDPILIIRKGLNKSVLPFAKNQLFRIVEIFLMGLLIIIIKNSLLNAFNNILGFILLFVITGIISILLFVIFNFRKEEYKYYKGFVVKIIGKFKCNILKNQ